jgi:hypothetical protein
MSGLADERIQSKDRHAKKIVNAHSQLHKARWLDPIRGCEHTVQISVE